MLYEVITTIVHKNTGTSTTAPWDAMQDAIKIRRGATATITNAYVKSLGTVQDGVDLSDSNGTAANGTNISVKFEVASFVITSYSIHYTKLYDTVFNSK